MRIIGVPQEYYVYENNLRIIGTISRIFIGTPEKSELPIYLAAAGGVYHHSLTLVNGGKTIAIANLPAWAATFCEIALIQSSSATAEHVQGLTEGGGGFNGSPLPSLFDRAFHCKFLVLYIF